MTINQRIRKIREKLKLSQFEFGENLGIDRSSMSKIEAGKLNLNYEGLQKLHQLYSINLNWLICGRGKMSLSGYNFGDNILNEPQETYKTEEERLNKELSDLKDEIIKEKEKRIGMLEKRLEDFEKKLESLVKKIKNNSN